MAEPLKVWFNGNELTQYLQVKMGKDKLILPDRDDTVISPGDMVGGELEDVKWGTRTIEMPFLISGGNVRDKAAEIARLLFVNEPKQLIFSDKDDRYWNAIPEGGIELPEDDVVNVEGTIKWKCYDPFAYAIKPTVVEFNSEQVPQTIQSDFAGKVPGNLTVPHSIYQAYEPITVAMASPSDYTNEIKQGLYSQLGNRDNQSAQLYSKAIRKFGTQPTKDDPNNGELGHIDSVTFNGDEFSIDGWYATNESVNKPNAYIIITDADWTNEYARIKIDRNERPDIPRYWPNVANAGMSGFRGTFKYQEKMNGRRLMIHLRYSDSDTGEGHWIDFTWLFGMNDYFQQTAPHFMIKVDVLQAIEKHQPGFWNKYGLAERSQQREWVRSNFVSAKVESFANGSSPLGQDAVMQIWDNESSWIGEQHVSGSTSMQMQYNYATADEFIKYVDSDGYMYVNIFPQYDTATGQGDSYINLDYFDFQIRISQPTSDSFVVENDGPLPVPIDFEVTNHGQNGFIGIHNDKNDSILIGVPDQMNTTEVKQSERLFTTNQNNANGLKQWRINKGVIISTTDDANKAMYVQTGSFEDPAVIQESRWRLRNSQQGSWGAWDDTMPDCWHGPSAHVDFGPDSNGTVGADNFTSRAYVQFLFGNMQQGGVQRLCLNNAEGESVILVEFWKNVGTNGGINIAFGNGGWAYSDNNNPRWNNFFGQIVMSRHGDVYTITIEDQEGGSGTREVFTYTDPVSAKQKVTGFTYWKGHWNGDWYQDMWNDLYDFWFTKDNVDKITDIPNTFADGDKVSITVDGNAVMTKNNGATFLDFQDMASVPVQAYPGKSVVTFSNSNYAQTPSVTATFRKIYL